MIAAVSARETSCSSRKRGSSIGFRTTLGPKEFFMLQLLSYKTAPACVICSFKDGPAEDIEIRPQKIFPLWFQVVSGGLFCIGLGFAIYWCIKAIMFLSKNWHRVRNESTEEKRNDNGEQVHTLWKDMRYYMTWWLFFGALAGLFTPVTSTASGVQRVCKCFGVSCSVRLADWCLLFCRTHLTGPETNTLLGD